MIHDPEFAIGLNAYADGELDEADRIQMEEHVVACEKCRSELDSILALKQALSAAQFQIEVPNGLELKVRRKLRAAQRRQALVKTLGAPIVGIAALAAAVSGLLVFQAGDIDEMVVRHERALTNGHLVEMSSSLSENIKPWLQERTEVAPPVLARIGNCVLVGARVESIGKKSASTLAYRCGDHVVDFYALADFHRSAESPSMLPKLVQSGPVHVVAWRRGRLNCYAVSDLPSSQLLNMARYIQDHAAEG